MCEFCFGTPKETTASAQHRARFSADVQPRFRHGAHAPSRAISRPIPTIPSDTCRTRPPTCFLNSIACTFWNRICSPTIRSLNIAAKLAPDPAVKTEFESELAKSDAAANKILAQKPDDKNALFAQVLANGLRGDYTALIEKRNLASLSYMKTSRTIAQKLLTVDPTCYDAYLAVGVENYLLGHQFGAGALDAAHDWCGDRQRRRLADDFASPPTRDITWRRLRGCCWRLRRCAIKIRRPRVLFWPDWPRNFPAINSTWLNSPGFSSCPELYNFGTHELGPWFRHPPMVRSAMRRLGPADSALDLSARAGAHLFLRIFLADLPDSRTHRAGGNSSGRRLSGRGGAAVRARRASGLLRHCCGCPAAITC